MGRRIGWWVWLPIHAAVGWATTIVTYPSGLLSNPGATLVSDPPAFGLWLRRNVRLDGAVGISGAYPRGGNGSCFLSLGNNFSNGGKADFEFFPDPTAFPMLFGRLGDVQHLAYEWYRDSQSTVPAHLHPVLRLVLDADGNLGTTNDQGFLIFERCYNYPSCPAAPTDQWVADAIGDSTVLWWYQIGVGAEPVFNRTLSTYKTGSYTPTPGFAQITGNSLIVGLSLGVGSGWVGPAPSFLGAVDHPSLETATFDATSLDVQNFELPDPAMNLGKTILSGDPFGSPGDVILYQLTVENTGNVTLTNVVVSDPLLGSLSCAPTQPATLAPGAILSCTGSYSVTVSDLNAGSVTNTATATAQDPGGNTVESQASATALALRADLALQKTVSPTNPPVGSPVTFTLTVTNLGPHGATSVVVNDLLPAGYSFQSASPSVGSYNPATGVWNVGTLAPGAAASLVIQAVVLAAGPYLNSAAVASSVGDPDLSNNQAAAEPQPQVAEPIPTLGGGALALLATLLAMLGSSTLRQWQS